MPHQWILDVLQDLRAYSRMNNLPRLGEDLDRLIVTARMEVLPEAPEARIAAPRPLDPRREV